MTIMETVRKQILLLGIIFVGFPVLWWQYNGMDEIRDQDSSYFLTVRFLTSTGFLLSSIGWAYLLLPFDLIPDVIPIFGNMDNMLAKMLFGAGLMMCYMGTKFGSGEIPVGVQITATIITTVYHRVIAPLMVMISPYVGPALGAILYPVKVLANVLLKILIGEVTKHSAAARNLTNEL